MIAAITIVESDQEGRGPGSWTGPFLPPGEAEARDGEEEGARGHQEAAERRIPTPTCWTESRSSVSSRSWVLIRASGTEDIVRVSAESPLCEGGPAARRLVPGERLKRLA